MGATSAQLIAVMSPKFGTPGCCSASTWQAAGSISAYQVSVPPVTASTAMSKPPYPVNRDPMRVTCPPRHPRSTVRAAGIPAGDRGERWGACLHMSLDALAGVAGQRWRAGGSLRACNVIPNGADRVRPAERAGIDGITDCNAHPTFTAFEVLSCQQRGF